MDIKKEIGQRIYRARKNKGLTRKALAELTDDLKPSRISNWEYGLRTPGPEEVKQLSKALKVSSAFLLCLTEEDHGFVKEESNARWIPLLNFQQSLDFTQLPENIKKHHVEIYIPINPKDVTSEHVFALKMYDESMEPELRRGDILLIDSKKMPIPGNYVIAKMKHQSEVVIRRYKELSSDDNNKDFELLALNHHWANIQGDRCTVIGTVFCLQRIL